MNTANLKRYAPKARIDFIAAMQKQAAHLGITAKHIEPLEVKGDIALIGGRTFPAQIKTARERLVSSIEQHGFANTIEQAAYSWFNRLCAIRFMEVHSYFDHGRRVLSSTQAGSHVPQILEECLDINLDSDLPSLDKQRIIELKLDGTQDEQLYRELLLAQCHALHQVMPFLFEAVDGALELLLPDNLTKTDSLIRELVGAIPEEDWQDVEIIGWLYQFYISDKKDQVIGKVVKSEDIPAATQLFTPNWIVQYLVQNSLGRQWLQTYPDSPLKAQMQYYIDAGEQPPAVLEKLAEITPKQLDPESIKVLDPACGSGHILVEAYKVLKAIYEERGHRSRDIPLLILTNNLFGLDIDDRAAQLASFTVLMLARADDRRIFSRLAENHVRLNILALQETNHLNLDTLWQALNLNKDWNTGASMGLFADEQQDLSSAQADQRYQLLADCLQRFAQAKTFGSLIDVPAEQYQALHELYQTLQQLAINGDNMQKPAAEQLLPYVQQAWMLAQRYDAVVANPPYMGSKGMNADLKTFANKAYPDSKSDLFAIFMEHAFSLLKPAGFNAQINMQSWMFLSSYEKLRDWLLQNSTIITMAHLGTRAFDSIGGEVVSTTAFSIQNLALTDYSGAYFRLVDGKSEAEKKQQLISSKQSPDKRQQFYRASATDFMKIPGSPVAYWISNKVREIFSKEDQIAAHIDAKQGLGTGDDSKFLRFHWEINFTSMAIGCRSSDEVWSIKSLKWVPLNKGGSFRKWSGNREYVIKFDKESRNLLKTLGNKLPSEERYFKPFITWSDITSRTNSFRVFNEGYLFSNTGHCAFPKNEEDKWILLAYCNNRFVDKMTKVLNPTIHFHVGYFNLLPYPKKIYSRPEEIVTTSKRMTYLSRMDWDAYETSWDFILLPLLAHDIKQPTISHSYTKLREQWLADTQEMQRLEEENNRIFIDAYGLQDELTPEVPLKEITLTCNPHYRYGGDLTDQEREDRLQSDTITELVSYVIGCMMGRYSLDREGLVYAHAGNEGFADLVAEGAYKTFAADDDGILPLTEQEWFSDDVTNRISEFVRTVWGEQQLEENLQFIADSLCLYALKAKKGERALDTIRRYLSNQFYKDHLKTYKRRPIYWLFSSGKHKAFECLVYLHRYHEGTLARMRAEYVIPLSSRINARINRLQEEAEAASSTSERKQLMAELKTLHNQQAELASFDEQLRHHADQRISLDLDDGVKENYGKFGNLLDSVRAVTGKAAQ